MSEEMNLKPEDYYKEKAHVIWTTGRSETELQCLIEELWELANTRYEPRINASNSANRR